MHTQCRMNREGTIYTAWIPSEFANVGKTVDLKVNGTWDRGWVVQQAFDSMEPNYVRERSSDYKTQRRASDV